MSNNSNDNTSSTTTDRLPEFTKTLSQKDRWLEEIGVLKSELQYAVVDNAMMRYEIPIPLILQTLYEFTILLEKFLREHKNYTTSEFELIKNSAKESITSTILSNPDIYDDDEKSKGYSE